MKTHTLLRNHPRSIVAERGATARRLTAGHEWRKGHKNIAESSIIIWRGDASCAFAVGVEKDGVSSFFELGTGHDSSLERHRKNYKARGRRSINTLYVINSLRKLSPLSPY